MIFEILVVMFAVFAVSRSYLRFRHSSESLAEFLLWIVIWTSIVVVVIFPGITAIPAQFFGIDRGIDLLIYVSLVFLLYSTYRIYAKIERVEQDITKLTREITLKRKGP